MTLTAPDNMLRRQAQERQNERRARKAAATAKKINRIATTAVLPRADASSSASRLDSIPNTQPSSPPLSRSVSPVRRGNPARGDTPSTLLPSSFSSGSIPSLAPPSSSRPSRRPRIVRTSSGPAASMSPGDHRPTSEEPRVAAVHAPATETAAMAPAGRLAPRASLRRHNIYRELAGMGLPGVESASDTSDDDGETSSARLPPATDSMVPPPPFPEGSTRPETPPRAPPDGFGEGDDNLLAWSSADERRWAEYRARVPNSPPPAFQSDEEDRVVEPGVATSQQVPQLLGATNDVDTPQAPTSLASGSQSSSSSDADEEDAISDEDRQAWNEDSRRGMSFEERLRRLELRRRRKEGMSAPRWEEQRRNEIAVRELLQREATQQEDTEEDSSRQSASASRSAAAAVAPVVNTGSASSGQAPYALTAESLGDGRISRPVQRARSSAEQPRSDRFTEGALSQSSLPTSPHRRSASDNRIPPAGDPKERNQAKIKRGKATAVRPRPSSESHSRFRDDASAAAERRRLAWGATPAALLEVPRAPIIQRVPSRPVTPVSLPANDSHSEGTAPHRSDSPSSDVSSDDSAAAWAAEAEAFEAMRKASEQAVAVSAESSDEEDHDPSATLSPATVLRGTLPKAPPPLALGRSRGAGIAYEASDSESSPDERRNAEPSDSDDSLSPDEDEVVRHINAKWAPPEPENVGPPPDRTTNQRRPSAQDKGKQPDRSHALYPANQQHRSASAPDVAATSHAGEFQSDSASSASFSDGDDGDPIKKPTDPLRRAPETAAIGRKNSVSSIRTTGGNSIWQDRLPGAPPATVVRPEVSDRLKGLFGASMPGSYIAPGGGSVQRAGSRGSLHDRTQTDVHSAMSSSQPRKSSESVTTSHRRPSGELRDQEQLRLDALRDIATLQRQRGGNSSGVNPHDPLAQLERALTRSLQQRSTSGDDAAKPPGAGLQRQGAISARRPPPPPPPSSIARMQFAPLPRQARLPIISDDTRHYPPSRTPTILESNGGSAEVAHRRAPPPIPGGHVSALRSRFESTSNSSSDAPRPPPVLPPRTHAAALDDSRLRRRPPPPPPPASTARPPSAVDEQPALPPRPLRPLSPLIGHQPIQAPAADDLLGIGDLSGDAGRNSPLPPISPNEQSTPRPLPVPPQVTGTSIPANEQLQSRARRLDRDAFYDASSQSHSSSIEVERSAVSRSRSLSTGIDRNANAPAQSVDMSTQHEHPARQPPSPAQPTQRQTPQREGSLGITDLDLLASQLELEGSHFDEIAAIQEFLGPAGNNTLSAMELNSLPCGPVEVEKRRTTAEGKVKTKLACLGLRVDRCGICLAQFKEGQMSIVLGCLHVFHDGCARPWFRRRSRACPTCRIEAVDAQASGN